MGQVKTAIDTYANKLQFGHVDTSTYQNVTTAVEWDASYDRYIVVTPTAADAWIKITAATNTPATNEGMLIKNGASYTTIIRAGEWIGASATVNVVELGEL
jgi:hypothetical protein